jgi:hypothetical protein
MDVLDFQQAIGFPAAIAKDHENDQRQPQPGQTDPLPGVKPAQQTRRGRQCDGCGGKSRLSGCGGMERTNPGYGGELFGASFGISGVALHTTISSTSHTSS